MKTATHQHLAGLELAMELASTPGTCMSDLPGMLEASLEEARLNHGDSLEEDLRRLARALRRCGATRRPMPYSDRFCRGMSRALALVEERLQRLD